mmetsp:Transcript_63210/g.110335  ORF Transcript_63210/g.110335 Transcript_63210/m.110335 type:complete len:219 (-) Transcript_63210:411-1067(-)
MMRSPDTNGEVSWTTTDYTSTTRDSGLSGAREACIICRPWKTRRPGRSSSQDAITSSSGSMAKVVAHSSGIVRNPTEAGTRQDLENENFLQDESRRAATSCCDLWRALQDLHLIALQDRRHALQDLRHALQDLRHALQDHRCLEECAAHQPRSEDCRDLLRQSHILVRGHGTSIPLRRAAPQYQRQPVAVWRQKARGQKARGKLSIRKCAKMATPWKR